MTDRNEEVRRLRELRLLRDERDREGEQAARGTAGSVLTALLACLLFTALRFPDPEKLALIYLLGCWLLMFRKFSGSREELLGKLLRLKPGKSAPAPPPDPGEEPGEDRP